MSLCLTVEIEPGLILSKGNSCLLLAKGSYLLLEDFMFLADAYSLMALFCSDKLMIS